MSDNVCCAVVLSCILIGLWTTLLTGVLVCAAAVVLVCLVAVGRAVWFFISDRLAGRVELAEYERDTAIADIVRLRHRATRLMLEVEQQEREEWACREIERQGW